MGPVEAAVTVAGRFGVVVEEPILLSDSNNVVVWLAPSGLVAKVGTGHHGRPAHDVAVAEHLRAVGAPIVPPADAGPVEVHVCDGFNVTFWSTTAAGTRRSTPDSWRTRCSTCTGDSPPTTAASPHFGSNLTPWVSCWPPHGGFRPWMKAIGRCW